MNFLPDARSLLYRWTDFTPDALFQARVALRRAAQAQGLSADVAGDAVLAGGELMANAVEHAWGPYELHAWQAAADFCCGVVDHDPRLPDIPLVPVVPAPGQEADPGPGCVSLDECNERGRGLRIVNELSRGVWGMRVLGRVKVVWWVVSVGGSN